MEPSFIKSIISSNTVLRTLTAELRANLGVRSENSPRTTEYGGTYLVSGSVGSNN